MEVYQKASEITELSAEAAATLGIKQRRARQILKTMADKGLIRKTGSAQYTKYIMA